MHSARRLGGDEPQHNDFRRTKQPEEKNTESPPNFNSWLVRRRGGMLTQNTKAASARAEFTAADQLREGDAVSALRARAKDKFF